MNIVTGIALIATGFAMLWAARKAATGTLERNWAMGLRTKRLMASEEAWEKGHKAAAPMLIVAGVASVIGGAVVIPQPDDGALGTGITLATAALILILVFLGVRQAHRAVEGS